jgi:hypothetical protein
MLYYDAITFCRDMKLAGYSDWRLPYLSELLTLIDTTKSAPPYIADGFKNIAKWEYWSYYTKDSGYPNYQDMYSETPVVNFNSGDFYPKEKYTTYDNHIYFTEHAYVRCVRGDNFELANHYLTHPDLW